MLFGFRRNTQKKGIFTSNILIMKRRVTGLGGVFFKVKDPAKIKEWYSKHLNLPMNEYGVSFRWIDPEDKDAKEPAQTIWSPFKSDTKYFQPGDQSFMLNYRVENLVELINTLREEGVQVVGDIVDESYGKFGWILDPEGNKIELWEPKD